MMRGNLTRHLLSTRMSVGPRCSALFRVVDREKVTTQYILKNIAARRRKIKQHLHHTHLTRLLLLHQTSSESRYNSRNLRNLRSNEQRRKRTMSSSSILKRGRKVGSGRKRGPEGLKISFRASPGGIHRFWYLRKRRRRRRKREDYHAS